MKKEVPKLDAQGQPMMDKDGKPLTEVQETQIPAFKIIPARIHTPTVFLENPTRFLLGRNCGIAVLGGSNTFSE